MAVMLTNSIVSNLVPEDGAVVSDKKVTGLKVRVSAGGGGIYYLFYMFRRKQRKYRIGKHGDIGVQEARRIAKKLHGQIANGIDPQAERIIDKESVRSDITLGKYLRDEYLAYIRAVHKVPESAEYILNHNFSGWMNKRLSDIDTRLMDKFVQGEKQREIGSNTINRAISVIKSMLNHAVRSGFLDTNRIAEYKLLKLDRKGVIRYLSADEEARLIEVLHSYDGRTGGKHMRTFIMLLLKTGLRPIELKKMEWMDVNWERGELTVRGKNSKSGQTRIIPLKGIARQELERWRDMEDDSQAGYIFKSRMRNTTTGYIYNTQQPWKTILKLAKITNFRLYDLRHSFASKLAINDVSIQKISHLLGHADIKMTMVYAHLCPDNLADSMSVLD